MTLFLDLYIYLTDTYTSITFLCRSVILKKKSILNLNLDTPCFDYVSKQWFLIFTWFFGKLLAPQAFA